MRIVLTCLLGVAACVAVVVGLGIAPADWVRGATTEGAPAVRPVGVLLSDEAAARQVKRSGFEPRPENQVANQRMPTRAELARFRRASRGQGVARRVTGRFTGTTSEIIEWAAYKWGFDAELLKAQAIAESSWRQEKVGDEGQSFGLMQIKRTVWRGSHPLTARSTAFNVDLAGAILRQAFDGKATWYLPDGYRRRDLWNSLGSYYSGRWRDAQGRRYVRRVWRHLRERAWTEPGF